MMSAAKRNSAQRHAYFVRFELEFSNKNGGIRSTFCQYDFFRGSCYCGGLLCGSPCIRHARRIKPLINNPLPVSQGSEDIEDPTYFFIFGIPFGDFFRAFAVLSGYSVKPTRTFSTRDS
jgi:hypothetical protein